MILWRNLDAQSNSWNRPEEAIVIANVKTEHRGSGVVIEVIEYLPVTDQDAP